MENKEIVEVTTGALNACPIKKVGTIILPLAVGGLVIFGLVKGIKVIKSRKAARKANVVTEDTQD